MRKIFSILILLVIFTISWMSSAMAFFTVTQVEMNMVMIEWSDKGSNHCNTSTSDNRESTHECCLSPFIDSWITSLTNVSQYNENKLKNKVIGFDLLALIQESFKDNYTQKLTSPPYWIPKNADNNIFVELTWIIKNNC